MKFSKMQAAGNDFILVNGMIEKSLNWNETAKKVCDRHFGIGADGLMFCESSSKADIKMHYYNSDGSSLFFQKLFLLLNILPMDYQNLFLLHL